MKANCQAVSIAMPTDMVANLDRMPPYNRTRHVVNAVRTYLEVQGGGKNPYGVDAAYFRGKLAIIQRDIAKFNPGELARVLTGLAVVAARSGEDEKERLEGVNTGLSAVYHGRGADGQARSPGDSAHGLGEGAQGKSEGGVDLYVCLNTYDMRRKLGETPGKAVAMIGIKYRAWEPCPVADRIFMRDCTNLPSVLPSWIRACK